MTCGQLQDAPEEPVTRIRTKMRPTSKRKCKMKDDTSNYNQ